MTGYSSNNRNWPSKPSPQNPPKNPCTFQIHQIGGGARRNWRFTVFRLRTKMESIEHVKGPSGQTREQTADSSRHTSNGHADLERPEGNDTVF